MELQLWCLLAHPCCWRTFQPTSTWTGVERLPTAAGHLPAGFLHWEVPAQGL